MFMRVISELCEFNAEFSEAIGNVRLIELRNA